MGRSEAGCHTARGGAGKGKGVGGKDNNCFFSVPYKDGGTSTWHSKTREGEGGGQSSHVFFCLFFLHSTDIEEVLLLPREKPRCDLSLVQASLAATQPCSPGLKQFRREKGGGSSVARLS
ncbi:unnamed protein product [Ixodes pacificus]